MRRNPAGDLPMVVFKDIPESKLKDIISKYAQLNLTEQELFDSVYNGKLKSILKRYKDKIVKGYELDKHRLHFHNQVMDRAFWKARKECAQRDEALGNDIVANTRLIANLDIYFTKTNLEDFKSHRELIHRFYEGLNNRLIDLEEEEELTLLQIFKLFLTTLLGKIGGPK